MPFSGWLTIGICRAPWQAVKSPRDSEAWRSAFSTNGETFRLSNNGPFPTTASLSWERGNPGGVFSVEPASLDLAEGETKEVTVWAFPKQVGRSTHHSLELRWGVQPQLRWGVRTTDPSHHHPGALVGHCCLPPPLCC